MKEKLRSYVESLFTETGNTKKSNELKEELFSNLCDKYDDLVSGGSSEEDAYKTAVEGIGDVNELIDALKRDNILDYAATQKERQKSAVFVASAVGLYILSVAVLILFSVLFPARGGEIGIIFMFVLIGIATSLLVYNGIAHTGYRKADDTIVEEFKEWKSCNTKKMSLKKAISSILWPLIVAVYFIISFFFDAWSYSWIIFIFGAALENLIRVIVDYKE